MPTRAAITDAELAELQKKGLAKNIGETLKHASRLSTPEMEAAALRAKAERERPANYTKEAEENLHAFNVAKIAALRAHGGAGGDAAEGDDVAMAMDHPAEGAPSPPALAFISDPGPSASDSLRRFLSAFATLATSSVSVRTDSDNDDDNNDGGGGVHEFAANQLVRALGEDEGKRLALAFKPAIDRTSNSWGDKKHSKRIVSSKLCAYANMFDAFTKFDGGISDTAGEADGDSAIQLAEWIYGYRIALRGSLFAGLEIESEEQARAVFGEIDVGGRGEVSFDEWCDYLEGREVAEETYMSPLFDGTAEQAEEEERLEAEKKAREDKEERLLPEAEKARQNEAEQEERLRLEAEKTREEVKEEGERLPLEAEEAAAAEAERKAAEEAKRLEEERAAAAAAEAQRLEEVRRAAEAAPAAAEAQRLDDERRAAEEAAAAAEAQRLEDERKAAEEAQRLEEEWAAATAAEAQRLEEERRAAEAAAAAAETQRLEDERRAAEEAAAAAEAQRLEDERKAAEEAQRLEEERAAAAAAEAQRLEEERRAAEAAAAAAEAQRLDDEIRAAEEAAAAAEAQRLEDEREAAEEEAKKLEEERRVRKEEEEEERRSLAEAGNVNQEEKMLRLEGEKKARKDRGGRIRMGAEEKTGAEGKLRRKAESVPQSSLPPKSPMKPPSRSRRTNHEGEMSVFERLYRNDTRSFSQGRVDSEYYLKSSFEA